MEEEKYLKKQRIYKTLMLIILTIFLTFILTTMYITNKYNLSTYDLSLLLNNSSSSEDISKTIDYIKQILDKYYLNDIDEEKIATSAIKGYVEGLEDPYTEYITKEEMEEYSVNLKGNYVGIGVYMTSNLQDNTIDIIGVIKDSPAEEAGLMAGDVIVSVDGIKYTGNDINNASTAIKGEEGTTVKLEILRKQEIKSFEITRKKVVTNPIIAKKLQDNIGYIQITSFDEETAEDFKNKYENLKNEGITSLIIDLRNNGGGLVDQALEIADYIVPKGKELLITADKNKNEEIEKAKQDVLIDMPIVMLVNGNTASSSEILAGALKDLNEATIVGTTTYGKGVIQQLMTFSDGSGLKLTTHEYYTPNRNKINGIGIEPNEIVELPEGVNAFTVTEENDTQLQRAIEILKES